MTPLVFHSSLAPQILETPHGNLSQIMQHINGAYTTYYNVKRKRVGHLFQGILR